MLVERLWGVLSLDELPQADSAHNCMFYSYAARWGGLVEVQHLVYYGVDAQRRVHDLSVHDGGDRVLSLFVVHVPARDLYRE